MTEQIKHLFDLEMYQRTATGGKDGPRSSTAIYVYSIWFAGFPEIEISTSRLRDDEFVCLYDLRGTVTVNHPELMAGSWGEILGDFRAAIIQQILDRGLAFKNDDGVWWKE